MPDAVMEMPATFEEVLHDVAKIKETLTEAVDSGVRSAVRAVKQGRYAAEDALDDAKHAVRKNPLAALGVIFAAGMLVGGVSVWIGVRRGDVKK
jgi:ElaB/YqjD/DUF883 family membrane-anchored ribosome-binding protein